MASTLRRRTLLAASLGLIGPSVAGAQALGLPLTRPTLLERARRDGAPALGYAVVGPEGLRALEVAGVRRIDRGAEVEPGDAWHIGAETQTLTSALYARLVEQGRAAWGARLPALFPGLKLDPAWDEVRIEALLAHRSGLSDRGLITTERLRAIRQDGRPVPEQRAAFAAEVLARPPAGQPDAYEVSNAGYVVAGAAIERMAGSSWEAAVTDSVFRPLGMDSAAFGPPQGAAPLGHERGGKGGLAPVESGTLADTPPLFGPANRVHLSLVDHAKFLRVFLADGAGFLTGDSLARLARPWGGGVEGAGLGWTTAERPWADGPVLTSEGSNGFWRSTTLVAPARGLGVITVSNADAGGGGEAARALSLALIALHTGQQAPARGRKGWLRF